MQNIVNQRCVAGDKNTSIGYRLKHSVVTIRFYLLQKVKKCSGCKNNNNFHFFALLKSFSVMLSPPERLILRQVYSAKFRFCSIF